MREFLDPALFVTLSIRFCLCLFQYCCYSLLKQQMPSQIYANDYF